MKVKDIIIDNGELPITATLFYGDDVFATIIALHGFTSNRRSDTIDNIASAATKEGIAVLSFDMFGHGDRISQDGAFTLQQSVSDFQKVIRYAQANVSDKIGIFCTSLGAYIGLISVASEKNISCIFLKSPALEPLKSLERIRNLAPEDNRLLLLIDSFANSISHYSDDANVYTLNWSDKNVKINIIYGENDDLVDYADIMRFVSLSPAISLLTLQEEGHRFTTPASQERTIEWFLSGLKELRE